MPEEFKLGSIETTNSNEVIEKKRRGCLYYALRDICKEGNLGNISHKLLRAGEEDLAKSIAQAGLCRAVSVVIDNANKFLASDKNIDLYRSTEGKIQHEPVHLFYDAKKNGLINLPCFEKLGRLLLSVYEASGPQALGGVANIASALGDTRKEEEAKKLDEEYRNAKENHTQVSTTTIEEDIILATNALEMFMREIENDPILESDEKSLREEVKRELKQKLGLDNADDQTVIQKVEEMDRSGELSTAVLVGQI